MASGGPAGAITLDLPLQGCQRGDASINGRTTPAPLGHVAPGRYFGK